MKCKNCSQPISQNFCPSCGQNAKVDRLNFSTILADLTESVFQMNKGLLFTLKEMTVRPGHSVRDYINGRRVKHFKPIAYAFALSTLYFLVSKFFDANTILNDAIEGVLLGDTDAADGNLSSEFQGKLDVIKTNYALLYAGANSCICFRFLYCFQRHWVQLSRTSCIDCFHYRASSPTLYFDYNPWGAHQ